MLFFRRKNTPQMIPSTKMINKIIDIFLNIFLSYHGTVTVTDDGVVKLCWGIDTKDTVYVPAARLMKL